MSIVCIYLMPESVILLLLLLLPFYHRSLFECDHCKMKMVVSAATAASLCVCACVLFANSACHILEIGNGN